MSPLFSAKGPSTPHRPLMHAARFLPQNIRFGRTRELTDTDRNLMMHIARHTFGNIAGDKISPRMLQKLYRHTSLITTLGYQKNFIHKEADDALDAVINFS